MPAYEIAANSPSADLPPADMECPAKQSLDPCPNKLGECTYTYTHLTGCAHIKTQPGCGQATLTQQPSRTGRCHCQCTNQKSKLDSSGMEHKNGCSKSQCENIYTGCAKHVKHCDTNGCCGRSQEKQCVSLWGCAVCENSVNNNKTTVKTTSICSTGSDKHACHACGSHNGVRTGCHKQTMPFGAMNAKQAANALSQLLVSLLLKNCGASTVAIDNKIEQAMDLVKSHLMFAVREEVLVLKEQIKDLLEKNSQLEYENSVLRAAATQETLTKLSQTNPGPTQSSSS